MGTFGLDRVSPMAGFLDLEPEANAEFIRLADQHVEVPGGKNVLPGVV